MAEPVIDATVGGASANSYATLAFADGYFADTLEAREWFSASPEDRARALISATSSAACSLVNGSNSSRRHIS